MVEEVRIFVEGGGKNAALQTECRRALKKFFGKAGLKEERLKIIACGPRSSAYNQFSKMVSHRTSEAARICLFVDSEDALASGKPKWEHVRNRAEDKWKQPKDASEDQLHFMVECMENWFLADKEALEAYFGSSFRRKALPSNQNVEDISKKDVLDGLARASKGTQKGSYSKGKHSFKILARLDPAKVQQASPQAKALLEWLRNPM